MSTKLGHYGNHSPRIFKAKIWFTHSQEEVIRVRVLRIHIIRDGILGALSDAQAQFRHNLFKGVAV